MTDPIPAAKLIAEHRRAIRALNSLPDTTELGWSLNLDPPDPARLYRRDPVTVRDARRALLAGTADPALIVDLVQDAHARLARQRERERIAARWADTRPLHCGADYD
ncbi:MAG: hypothetical protein ACLP3C_15630 [Mycobacterium sp.]|uniref:hypothetical protein n=1 Tax=Mycobacterium sp. TaxID=1785 RepID=UPI003F96B952